MKARQLQVALAVAATLGASGAMAQTSLQVYGKLYPYVVRDLGSDPTPVGTPVSTLSAAPTGTKGVGGATGMVSGNSYIGFRGKEDLGDGVRAIFQLEGQINVDNGSGAASGGGYMFNRNTYVGLDGKYGDLELGVNDTIFKTYGDTIRFLGLASGTFMSTSSVLRKAGFGTSSASSFHLRRANSIQYETPDYKGFMAGFQWSTDEAKTGTRNPHVMSAGLKYDSESFYAAIAHEVHYDLFGGSANAPAAQRNNAAADPTRSKDKATQVTFEYRTNFLNAAHRFEFDAIRKEYNENATVAGRFQNYHNMAYLFAMENRWGLFRTSAHYVKSKAGSCTRVNAVCTTDGLEGSKLTIGGAYYLSKRTFLFASANRVWNGKAARYSSVEVGGNPAPGENITQFALGVSHNF